MVRSHHQLKDLNLSKLQEMMEDRGMCVGEEVR